MNEGLDVRGRGVIIQEDWEEKEFENEGLLRGDCREHRGRMYACETEIDREEEG